MRAGSVLVAALALGLTPSAEAQFGKITKKAQEAITKDTQRTKPPCAVEFDSVVVELKSDMLTRVVAGLRASGAVKGRGGMTPREMVSRSGQVSNERAVLLEGRDDDFLRFQDRSIAHGNCMHDAIEQAREERSARMGELIMTAGATNSKLIEDMQRLTMKQQERLAAGDTAGARQAEAELARLAGGDPKADTTKAAATCGRAPAKPAWLVTTDSLNDESNRLLVEARMLEQRADTVGARAAGLDVQQFAMAKERVVAYVRGDGKPGVVGCFTETEHTALDARMSELKGLVD
jgi:hypothetical protein